MSEYGEHLVHFFSGKTGLNQGRRKDDWNQIVVELMENVAGKLYTDKKLRGKGIKDLLTEFNNFEKHDTWCIDSGASDDGYGVQLVIVWDGDIPPEPQKTVLPKVPVKVKIVKGERKQKVAVEEDELETVEEPEVQMVVELAEG